jgi:hypothetical protein
MLRIRSCMLWTVLTVLAGCTLMWPGGFQVQHADKQGMEIWYDPMLAHVGELDNAAKRHCAQFDLNSEVSKTQHGMGIVSNKVWYACVPKS